MDIDMDNFGKGGEEEARAEAEEETSFLDSMSNWELDPGLDMDQLTERVERLRDNDTTSSAAEKRSLTYRRKAYIRELFGMDVVKGDGRYLKELLEKISIEGDDGLSYDGTKVVVVDRATGKLRYSKSASLKVGAFKTALDNAYHEREEITAWPNQAQERLATRNDLEADRISPEIEELPFDSRGMVGVLEMDVSNVMETDRLQPGFADNKILTINNVEKPYWEDRARKAANAHDRGLSSPWQGCAT